MSLSSSPFIARVTTDWFSDWPGVRLILKVDNTCSQQKVGHVGLHGLNHHHLFLFDWKLTLYSRFLKHTLLSRFFSLKGRFKGLLTQIGCELALCGLSSLTSTKTQILIPKSTYISPHPPNPKSLLNFRSWNRFPSTKSLNPATKLLW